jgi:hypothetical protein
MKATIEFDDKLYRRLKAEAALQGQTVKELVTEGVRRVLDEPPREPVAHEDSAGAEAWFGALRAYAGKARGTHSLQAVRESIARGRRSGSSSAS